MSFLAALPFVKDLSKIFFGDKEKRDKYDADTAAAIHSQFAAEFGHSKNAYDSFIDGLNRLPRPMFAFGTMYLFILCWTDPVTFARGAQNLQLIPYEMWWILGTIVVFFFGGRLTKEFGKYKIGTKITEFSKGLSVSPKIDPRPYSEIEPGKSKDPQEGIEWEERVKKRYQHEDPGGYNG